MQTSCIPSSVGRCKKTLRVAWSFVKLFSDLALLCVAAAGFYTIVEEGEEGEDLEVRNSSGLFPELTSLRRVLYNRCEEGEEPEPAPAATHLCASSAPTTASAEGSNASAFGSRAAERGGAHEFSV